MMDEKTTIYIEPELKEKVQIRLIQEGEKKSLSKLVNELLKEWVTKKD